jgi:hypothetical protein
VKVRLPHRTLEEIETVPANIRQSSMAVIAREDIPWRPTHDGPFQ